MAGGRWSWAEGLETLMLRYENLKLQFAKMETSKSSCFIA